MGHSGNPVPGKVPGAAASLGDMTLLSLDPDQLLSTTRAVRKRLDFSRPVPDQLVRECVAMALQAPSGSNLVTMRFVVVRDEQKRQAIGDIYRQVYAQYRASPGYPGPRSSRRPCCGRAPTRPRPGKTGRLTGRR
jgi:hypothetical protein